MCTGFHCDFQDPSHRPSRATRSKETFGEQKATKRADQSKNHKNTKSLHNVRRGNCTHPYKAAQYPSSLF